eukprot:490419_1
MKSFILASLLIIITISKQPRIIRHLLSSTFNQCIGTDKNCHSINGILTCDAGFKHGCGNIPLYQDCNKYCQQCDGCKEGSIGCGPFNQCEPNWVSACGNIYELYKDCDKDCLPKKFDQCPRSDRNCGTTRTANYPHYVLNCNNGYVSSCGPSLTENCNENCKLSEVETVSR